MSNTVIVIDAGGRGSALVDAYAKSPHIDRIIAIPGNDLMQINTTKKVITHQNLKTTSVKEIVEIAKKEQPVFVDVAQDNAIAVGLADALQKEGIKVFGPTQKAGQIEWDKSWARDFGVRHGLPQPAFQSFNSIEAGIEFIKSHSAQQSSVGDKQWFIKAAGLAEGKGVLPANNNVEAIEKIKELNETFRSAAETYLVEEWMVGEEFSSFAISDGENFQIVGSAQDHKRVYDGDTGPNTGGMGCSTPPLVVTSEIMKQVEEIFTKTIKALSQEGRPYKGVLYLGGIIKQGTSDVYIIEFNSRWGDPEVEVILPSIKTDLYDINMAVIEGDITKVNIETDEKARVAVAAASTGYPIDYSAVKGKKISGLEKVIALPGIKVYGAGVKKIDNNYVINGGRLFYVVGQGRNVIEAREKAYSAMSMISIEDEGLHFRKDIGYRDVERLRK